MPPLHADEILYTHCNDLQPPLLHWFSQFYSYWPWRCLVLGLRSPLQRYYIPPVTNKHNKLAADLIFLLLRFSEIPAGC